MALHHFQEIYVHSSTAENAIIFMKSVYAYFHGYRFYPCPWAGGVRCFALTPSCK